MSHGRLFVFGDIHGCLDQLKALHAKVEPKLKHPDDHVVFLGDYVDRGPDSKGVVDFLIDLDEKHPGRYTFLRGNHEDMMLNDVSNFLYNGGRETLNSYGYNPENHPYLLDCVPAIHKQFYNATQLYYKRNRVVCVHAGIDPVKKLEDQRERDMIWERAWVGYDGDYVDNAFVVYGHTPRPSIVQRRNQLGIDTACVFDGWLTCAVIDDISGNVDEIIQERNHEDFTEMFD